MSPRTPLVLVSFLLGVVGCGVSSLEALANKPPQYKCSSDHPRCPPDMACDKRNGICVLKCVPGTTQPCGSDVGVCMAGTQTCGADGLPGECTGSVGPASDDVCDGLDNDCDGKTDSDLLLAKGQPLANTPGVALLSGNVLLVATEESSKIVLRSTTNGAAVQDVVTLDSRGDKDMTPALVTEVAGETPGESALLGWVTQLSDNSLSLSLLRQSKSGARTPVLTRSPFMSAPTSGSSLFVTGLMLAVNGTHTLMLVSTSTVSPLVDDASGVQQTWAVEVFNNAVGSPVMSTPLNLATPTAHFGLAAAAGRGTGFVVAYEHQGKRMTATLDVGSVPPYTLATTAQFTLSEDAGTHSPFIVSPSSTGSSSDDSHTVYFVRNFADGKGSAIASSTCQTTAASGPPVHKCTAGVDVYTSTQTIVRARMGQTPQGGLDTALLSWTEKDADHPSLSALEAAGRGFSLDFPLVESETFNETLFVPSGDRRGVVYLQKEDPSKPDAPSTRAEIHVMHFCHPH